jgi:hypothetical protein
MKRVIVFGLALAACVVEGPAPKDSEPSDPDLYAKTGGAPTDPIGPDVRRAVCPELVLGVVRCADLAPECATAPAASEEGGLHCLPQYADDPSVPCFCVRTTGSDSWCIR